jgi:hypothetical protein
VTLFNVTFDNPLSGERGVLIDDVTEAQADDIVARFSDKSSPFLYLPGVRKEPSAESKVPA